MGLIRRHVAGAAITLLLALTASVTVQLASGDAPVISASAAAAAVSSEAQFTPESDTASTSQPRYFKQHTAPAG